MRPAARAGRIRARRRPPAWHRETCRPGFFANNTCGANYGNDRLDTQCSSCPEDYFCPGTNTFQQPLLCSEQRCGANQQVATLCNVTHNITFKACQANSWSYAGRCETCASGTFTSVSASITCQSCQHDCSDYTLPAVVIADFAGIASIEDQQRTAVGGSSRGNWLAYATSIGANTYAISGKAGAGVV
jgi:hypothetical protein